MGTLGIWGVGGIYEGEKGVITRNKGANSLQSTKSPEGHGSLDFYDGNDHWMILVQK